MGLHLIAVTWDWTLLLVILQVAVGLGFVIFVHELGHFAVAKACGVKCEKFYLGFDIYGLKLCKFQWGETEYGIGILPLGGYVKMLGQDDNPNRAAEERQRSMVAVDKPGSAQQTLAAEQAAGATAADSNVAASRDAAESYELDPRSYMAKSVPQRMAIISAGVIMNVIFAFVMAAIAYRMGVHETPCAISQVIPGEAAWQADMRPGDEILQIGDQVPPYPLRFRDLMTSVALGNISEGVGFKIKREGVAEPFWVTVRPDSKIKQRMRPTIGAVPVRTTTIADVVGYPYTPAALAKDILPNDKVVAVNGTAVNDYPELLAQFVANRDQPLKLTLERKPKDDQDKPAEKIPAEVAPRPRRTLGLVMKVGKITAVQANSPAAQAGLEAGDFIDQIDGVDWSELDPVTLEDRFRGRGGETISVTVTRDSPSGKSQPLPKEIVLRTPDWSEMPIAPGNPSSSPSLGIAYRVLNVVHRVEEGSPARKAVLMNGDQKAAVSQLVPGDTIVRAEIIPGDEKEAEALKKAKPIEFSDENPNWPWFMYELMDLSPQAKVRLTLSDGRTTEIQPVDNHESYIADRGFLFEYDSKISRADSWGQAIAMGRRETKDSLLQVYAFLRRIGTQISIYGLGGPKSIAEAAGSAAYQGIPELLIFLTMLSANLAVVNFLPIPLLDGGHMVFLTLEGIFRRPVSEKVVVAFHYAGFLFIIGIMGFVLSLDFGLISRPH